MSDLLFEAITVATTVAERTAGVVDPTAGSAVMAWGESGPERPSAMGVHARLERGDGAAVTVGDWPPNDADPVLSQPDADFL